MMEDVNLNSFVTDVEQALRRDLRRTKALLQDAQLILQKNKDGAGSRTTVKQLRNQVRVIASSL
jgi:hypothetical protein